MADSVQLRIMASDDLPAAIALARSLPEWFNDRGLAQMAVDLHHQRGAVIEENGECVGFVTWLSRAGVGEIGWIAVAPDHHRRGYGARLLEFAEDRLRRSGAAEVRVATLGESVDYEPYQRTRAFYRAAGFLDFESVMTGDPGMPESLTLQKSLSPLPPN